MFFYLFCISCSRCPFYFYKNDLKINHVCNQDVLNCFYSSESQENYTENIKLCEKIVFEYDKAIFNLGELELKKRHLYKRIEKCKPCSSLHKSQNPVYSLACNSAGKKCENNFIFYNSIDKYESLLPTIRNCYKKFRKYLYMVKKEGKRSFIDMINIIDETKILVFDKYNHYMKPISGIVKKNISFIPEEKDVPINYILEREEKTNKKFSKIYNLVCDERDKKYNEIKIENIKFKKEKKLINNLIPYVDLNENNSNLLSKKKSQSITSIFKNPFGSLKSKNIFKRFSMQINNIATSNNNDIKPHELEQPLSLILDHSNDFMFYNEKDKKSKKIDKENTETEKIYKYLEYDISKTLNDIGYLIDELYNSINFFYNVDILRRRIIQEYFYNLNCELEEMKKINL